MVGNARARRRSSGNRLGPFPLGPQRVSLSGHWPGGRRIPQKIAFSVQFPRARQTYEGFLWTEGKNAIAGSVSMLDHPYSFIAIREGTSLVSDTIDLGAPPTTPDKVGSPSRQPGSRVRPLRARRPGPLRSGADRGLVEGREGRARRRPCCSVLADAVPFERVRRAADAIRAAGVTSIQLAPATRTRRPGLNST